MLFNDIYIRKKNNLFKFLFMNTGILFNSFIKLVIFTWIRVHERETLQLRLINLRRKKPNIYEYDGRKKY